MRTGPLVLIGMLVLPALAAAQTEVVHFRMAPDPSNGEDCRALDTGLRSVHTLTVHDGQAMITSTGGLEGRMTARAPGVYGMTFELTGRRVDGIADLGNPQRLVVTERDRPCRWSAKGS